jgi:hypothetical protein
MTMRDLIDKLKTQPQTADEEWEARKREWLHAIQALFSQIEGWLGPAVAEGVLWVRQSQTEISEQDLGNYMVPVLEIRDSRRTVRVEPVGLRVTGVISSRGRSHLGLRGRVNLTWGPTRIPLVRTATGAWKALPPGGEPCDVTEESFAQLLEELLLKAPVLDDADRRKAFLDRLAKGLRDRELDFVSAAFGRAAGKVPVWMVTIRTKDGRVQTKRVDLPAETDPDADTTCDSVVKSLAGEAL